MRRHAFTGFDAAARYERAGNWLLATIYRNEKALEWCKSNAVVIQSAVAEGIGSSGGFLVPTELARAILDLRDSYGAFRRRARIVPMASDNTSVPRRSGGAGAFFMAENATATETNATIDNLSLTAKKIGSLIRISSELEEDAVSYMVDFVANEIAYAFAVKEDDCAFNGDGTSTYGKMVGLATIVLDGRHNSAKITAAHNTFLTLDAIDLGNVVKAVQASAIPNAAWFCSQTAFAQTFCRLVAAGDGYMDTREVDGIHTPFYLGFPVILTQKLPLVSTSLSGSVMLAFGDMYQAAALGQRRTITLARSSDRYLDQDQIAVLGTERFHAIIHDIGDNSNVGALAALVGS